MKALSSFIQVTLGLSGIERLSGNGRLLRDRHVLKIWNPWAPKQSIKSSVTDNCKNEEKIASCPFADKKEVIETSCKKELIDKKTD
ncbi:hypothetical protein TNIN_317521 [Trichonephila inaurata madagascariensis]|uniref:Uncharacterized protein n=1 Tax=Trichonephila inaurata madagascariensis TaxID=2747483 RepID=A0A8X6YAT2_9ARAC|nr:hypothetical protein TNIN_317521 [Trichonephila inaurata madagascariensis]